MNIRAAVQHYISHVKQKSRKFCDEQASVHLFMQGITGVVDEVLAANSAFSSAREVEMTDCGVLSHIKLIQW